VFRAGIQTVPVGHREAAQVLGLTTTQSFVRIVGRRPFAACLPPLAANFVQLIKYSSLASVVSVSEVTRRGMELSSSTFRPLEIFTFIAVIYFVICWPLTPLESGSGNPPCTPLIKFAAPSRTTAPARSWIWPCG